MIKCDYHIHTHYCDGKSSPLEMIVSAINMGLTTIGFSGHSYTDFDGSFCMSLENTKQYFDEVSALKEKHKDKIKILCGIEQDYFSNQPTNKFDYVIGSVHYVKKDGVYFDVDRSREYLEKVVSEHFDGDMLSFCEEYFDLVSKVVEATNADIIGHFDLVSKFNEGDCLFDSGNSRYVAAWQKAVDRLLPFGKPFEINVGAISRGYRKAPYPSKDMITYIASKGGRFVLNSDSHSADNICFEFEKWYKWATDLGAEFVDLTV